MEEVKRQPKKSIRFFNHREVRAVWDDENNCWWFSATDIVRAINNEPDYTKAGNYWRWLKRKLKQEGIQLVSATHGFKFEAPDGKLRVADVLNSENVALLAKHYPNNRANEFLDWFTYSDNTLDGQSRKKAYQLYESGLLRTLEPGSIKCLQQIHAYIFGGLYDFAGQIRTKNISKGGFTFANCLHFPETLQVIERMPETSFDEIMDKYIEMNVAHPFMEGNGRATRIWLDLMLKRSLKRCVDWSQIDKNEYLAAMRESLGELIDLINGFAFKSKDFVTSGIPVIKIKNVKPNRILLNDLSYVSAKTAQNAKCTKIQPSDILITMTGNRKDGGIDSWVGKVALFNHEGQYLLNQRVSAIRIKSPNIVDYRYLAYLLSSFESQLYFINHSNSSGGQANISPDVVNSYTVNLPSLQEQKTYQNY